MKILDAGLHTKGPVFFCLLLSAAGCNSGSVSNTPDVTTSAIGLQSSDRSLAQQNLQVVLESSLSGKSQSWQNPQSGARGSATPLKTWKTTDGTYCRSYKESIRLASGESIDRDGVACRSSDAVWQST